MQNLVESSLQTNPFLGAPQHIFQSFDSTRVALVKVPMTVDTHIKSRSALPACVQRSLSGFHDSKESQQPSDIPALFPLHSQHVYHPSTSTCDHTLLTSTNTATVSSNSSTPASGSLNRSRLNSSEQVSIVTSQEPPGLQTLATEVVASGTPPGSYLTRLSVVPFPTRRRSPPKSDNEEREAGGITVSADSTPIQEPPSKHAHHDPNNRSPNGDEEGKATLNEDDQEEYEGDEDERPPWRGATPPPGRPTSSGDSPCGGVSSPSSEGSKTASPTRRSRPTLRCLAAYRPLGRGERPETAPPRRATPPSPAPSRELTSRGPSPRQPTGTGEKPGPTRGEEGGAVAAAAPGAAATTTTPLSPSPSVALQLTEVQFARLGITQFVTYMCDLNKGDPVPSSDFHSHCMPQMSVKSYIDRIVRHCNCTGEALLCGFMLLLKYTFHTGHPITVYNAHRLLITGILLGIKLRDDTYFNNVYYSKIGGITAKEMYKLELIFLTKMEWEIHISEVEYAVMHKRLGELIKEPTQEELAAFQVAYPHKVEAFNLQEVQFDTPLHDSKAAEGSTEEAKTQKDPEAAAKARVLGAYRRHHWETHIEPWLKELSEGTFRTKYERQAVEKMNWDAVEAKWQRYREEDNIRLSKRGSVERSRWLSPMTLNSTQAQGSAGASDAQSGAIASRFNAAPTQVPITSAVAPQLRTGFPPTYLNKPPLSPGGDRLASHGYSRAAPSGGLSGMVGIVGRVQQPQESRRRTHGGWGGADFTLREPSPSGEGQSASNPPANPPHPSRESTTPGSGININAQPYYYVSSRQKLQQKQQATGGTAVESLASVPTSNGNSGGGNVPHMRCSNWRSPALNEETFPFQRKQPLSFGCVAPQSKYVDRRGGNKPGNCSEENGGSHMNCSNFVAYQKSDPCRHSEGGSVISPSSKHSGRGADHAVEIQQCQEKSLHQGVCFPSAPLRGFPNHGPRDNGSAFYSLGSHQKHAQGSIGSVGKKRPKPDAYVDRLYRD